MAHKVTLIPGDGIGPEVTAAAVRVLEATGVGFQWESYAAGADAFAKYHEYIPRELTESIERTFRGDRQRIREWATQQALDLVRRRLR